MTKLLNESISNLPKKCKEVFILSKKDGLTNIEIAEYLNISIKTVESHITQAFKLLKKSIPVNL
jgi:RNA polymerase sigma-70 factor (ECF subfamily)